MDLKTLQREALSLDARSRAELAQRLLKSLDSLSEREIAELWADEAERRLLGYGQGGYGRGDSEAMPAEEVMRDARRRLT